MAPRTNMHPLLLLATLGCSLAGVSMPALGDDLFVPGDFPTIQAAIDAAHTDDSVIVAPGTYEEALTIDKRITVRSEMGPEVTIIDGFADDSVVEILDDAVLRGFTVTGGGGTRGGGIRVTATFVSATIADCIVRQNLLSGGFGGGILVDDDATSTTIVNCDVHDNRASSNGGGIHVRRPAAVRNCTIRGNTVFNGDEGGGIFVAGNGALTLSNSILWENFSGGGAFDQIGGPGAIDVSYCDVQGAWPGVGNFDEDPRFFGTTSRLERFSPCVDAGNNALVPPGTAFDLVGNARFRDDVNRFDTGVGASPLVDVGARERQEDSTFPILVPADFASIQKSIDVVGRHAVDAVIDVSEGLYRENIDLRGKALHLIATPFAVIEGQDGDGCLGGSVVTCASSEGPDTVIENFFFSFGCGTDDPQAGGRAGGGLFISFSSPTLRNCAFTDNLAEYGGGVYIRGGSPTFIGGRFDRNQAARTFENPEGPQTVDGTGSGGAIYIDAAAPSFEGTTFGNFERNTAGLEGGAITVRDYGVVLLSDAAEFRGNFAGRGGAIYNADNSMVIADGCFFRSNSAADTGGAIESGALCSLFLSDCVFEDNIAESGGAVSIVASGGDVRRCTFARNFAMRGGAVNASIVTPPPLGPPLRFVSSVFIDNLAGTGAGVFNGGASPQFANCLFDGNVAATYGGGLCNTSNSFPEVVNCVFAANDAFDGGAIQNFSLMSVTTIANTIIWGNTAGASASIGGVGTSFVRNSNVEGGAPGLNNIDTDPLFVGNEDRRLLPGSPCIDEGDNASLPADATDLDGDGNTTEPLPHDLAGAPRIENGRVDMGVYEGAAAVCRGDADGDGEIAFGDVIYLLSVWGTADPVGDVAPPGGDGTVDFQDVVFLLANWGGCG